MKRHIIIGFAVLASLGLAACGQPRDDGAAASVGGPAEPLTVTAALTTDAKGPLRIRGALFFDGKRARLCDGLAESDPPQCVEGTTVTGFDACILPPDAGRKGQIRWVDSIELIVTRENDSLRYVSTAT